MSGCWYSITACVCGQRRCCEHSHIQARSRAGCSFSRNFLTDFASGGTKQRHINSRIGRTANYPVPLSRCTNGTVCFAHPEFEGRRRCEEKKIKRGAAVRYFRNGAPARMAPGCQCAHHRSSDQSLTNPRKQGLRGSSCAWRHNAPHDTKGALYKVHPHRTATPNSREDARGRSWHGSSDLFRVQPALEAWW